MLYWCAAVIQEGINHWEKRRERVPRVQCKTQKHKPGLQVLYSVIMFSSLTHAVVSRVFFIVQAKASRNPRQANGKCFCFYARNNTKYPFFQKSTCFVGICVCESTSVAWEMLGCQCHGYQESLTDPLWSWCCLKREKASTRMDDQIQNSSPS